MCVWSGKVPGVLKGSREDSVSSEPSPHATQSNVSPMSAMSPMSQLQWSNESNAGFSDGLSTWLPVNQNYPWLNLANQVACFVVLIGACP